MAAKKPIKSKSSSYISRHRKAVKVVGIICAVLLLLFVVYKIKHGYDQRILVRNINQAGADLDVLADEIRQTGIFDNVERTKFCYEAARKFKKGPTYCSQRIDAEIKGVDETSGLEIADRLAVVIEGNDAFGFKLKKDKYYPYNDGKLTISYDVFDKSSQYPFKKCLGSITSLLSTGTKGVAGAYLELDVECRTGNFDEYIYPADD